MERRRLLELATIGLWLIIAVVLFIQHNSINDVPLPDKLVVPTLPETEKGKEFIVKKVTVLSGNKFDLVLEDNRRILGNIDVFTTSDAKKRIIDLLNHSMNPKVVLREKQQDGHWKINFLVTIENEEINLNEWLELNNLVYK